MTDNWYFNKEKNTVSKYRIYSTVDGRNIVWVDPDEESSDKELKNIRLIAAAPELLDVLEMVTYYSEFGSEDMKMQTRDKAKKLLNRINSEM